MISVLYLIHDRHSIDDAGDPWRRALTSNSVCASVPFCVTGRHRYLVGIGVSTGASEWLAERGMLAEGADNMAWDVLGFKAPGFGCHLAGHLVLLVRYGIYIVENLQLDELSSTGEHRFTFIRGPLSWQERGPSIATSGREGNVEQG